MKVHLRQIPAEGLHLEGEEECPIPQLDPKEARCTGPLRYNLDLGISEGALWANGELHQPVELHCVRCLEAFPYEIAVPDFALHTELAGPEVVDLTPFMREDVLLNLAALSALRSRWRPDLSGARGEGKRSRTMSRWKRVRRTGARSTNSTLDLHGGRLFFLNFLLS